MKIDISSVDTTQFYVNQHIIGGHVVYLILPRQIGAVWTKDNLHLRSSIWDFEGNAVSLSFKKFFNFGEKPELSPPPQNLNDAVVVAKEDGSTIIISKWKNEFIIRSRGTINAYILATGDEMNILKSKYPKLFEMDAHMDTWNYSVITEYVSPKNQIVIKYDKVDFILTGIISHNDYSLMEQDKLDEMATRLDMPRPTTFTFKTVEDIITNVKKWEDKEGVVLYCKEGQQLLKIKAAKYLFLHRMKSELSSIEKVVDVWIAQGYPSYTDFYNFITTTFDYELAEYCKSSISKIADAYKEVLTIIDGFKAFVDKHKDLSRKEFAIIAFQSYGGEKNSRTSFLFQILDGKNLIDNKDAIKKLIFQCLKQ